MFIVEKLCESGNLFIKIYSKAVVDELKRTEPDCIIYEVKEVSRTDNLYIFARGMSFKSGKGEPVEGHFKTKNDFLYWKEANMVSIFYLSFNDQEILEEDL